MARSSSGKSVARAAATGGGTTYRGQMPVNWYAALVLIVLLGIGSVAIAKTHYNSSNVTEPAINTTWHAGLAFDICGTAQPALAASPDGGTSGLTTTGSGVLQIAPRTSAEAGNNATLGKFASEYSGLTLTNTTLKLPGTTVPQYKNGQKCAAGTPDAGQKGTLRVRTWVLSTSTGTNGKVKETGGQYSAKPKSLKFANRQLITVGFGPTTKTLPKPPTATITALLQELQGNGPVTSTTVAPSTTLPVTTTPTTVAGATTTTTPVATTTTVPVATTTTKPSTTTTTKPTK
jgi:hypothetical protein